MTQDPIQRLLDEHAELQARLEPFRRAVRELAAGGQERVADALPALRAGARVMNTELIAHAHREDEVFFPAVEAAIGGAFGPTMMMRREHVAIHAGAERFQSTLHELQDVQHPAIVAGGVRLHDMVEGAAEAGALTEIGERLLALIDDHFAKEEQILFPMSRNILDAERMRTVALQLDQLDAG
jgi:iron-sulfur cluster repair protein YtfE (RIC family)